MTALSLQQPSPVCHSDRSEPEFPASLHWTGPRVRLSLKERRMTFDNATNFYRKFGVAEGRGLQCATRVPQIYRSTTTLPLSFRPPRRPVERSTDSLPATNLSWKLLKPAHTDIDYEHMSAEKRLLELGLTLPEPPAPGGNYVSAKTFGNLALPFRSHLHRHQRNHHRNRRRRSNHH